MLFFSPALVGAVRQTVLAGRSVFDMICFWRKGKAVSQRRNRLNIFGVGLFYLLLWAVAWGWDQWQPLIQIPRCGQAPLRLWLRHGQAAVLLAAVVISISLLGVKGLPPWRRLCREMRQRLAPLSQAQILLLAACSALGEEFFFRGLVQGKIGLLGASLLFALLHVGPRLLYLWWTAFAVVVGLALGLLYQRSHNILAPTLAHFLINAVNLYALRFLPQEKDADGALSA